MGTSFSRIFNKKKKNNTLTKSKSEPAQDVAVCSPPTLPVKQVKRVKVRALFSYIGQNPSDLSFHKNDIMIILSDTSELWWLAEHSTTKVQGYIPSNYVVVDDGLPTSLDAWFKIERPDATRMLYMVGIPSGSYIVRPSKDSPNMFALTVRYELADGIEIKHYKIKPMDDGSGYYIGPYVTKPTVKLLIEHYRENPLYNGMVLTDPCPRTYRPPVQWRDLEIDRDTIKYGTKLGSGFFGEVWQAKWTGVLDVAVKTLKTNVSESSTALAVEESRQKFIEEAKIMHKLRHERIVQLLGICTKPATEPALIITELMAKNSLLEFLRSSEGRNLDLHKDLLDMMAQICEGMAYLEEQKFVHRDLRAANILVASDNSVKVADFGLARLQEEDVYTGDHTAKFPLKWTAPEAALRRDFTVKSDRWSFGVVIYEIITYGNIPYPGMTGNEVIQKITYNNYRMPNPNSAQCKCPDGLYGIMLKCWSINPDDRYTFTFMRQTFENWAISDETQYIVA